MILIEATSLQEMRELSNLSGQEFKQHGCFVRASDLLELANIEENLCSLSPKERRQTYKMVYPQKKIADEHKRRAKKRATFIGDREEYEAFVHRVRTARKMRCYWCKKQTPISRRHVDHIIPIAKGGADHVHNLCMACNKCNVSKNDKMPGDGWGEQRLLAFAPVTHVGPSKRDVARAEAEKRREREQAEARERAILVKTRTHLVPLCMGDTAFVPLTRGAWAMIDKDDWTLVAKHMWSLQMKRSDRNSRVVLRAKTNVSSGAMLLQNCIAGGSAGIINGNALDCRRANIRTIDVRQTGRRESKGWMQQILSSA